MSVLVLVQFLIIHSIGVGSYSVEPQIEIHGPISSYSSVFIDRSYKDNSQSIDHKYEINNNVCDTVCSPIQIDSKNGINDHEMLINNIHNFKIYDNKNDNKNNNTYVIITSEQLTHAVNSLQRWEETKGNQVHLVNTSWINETYEGIDLAQKIRRFLRQYYTEDQWNITYVLLVGSPVDLPMRRVCVDNGFGKPLTDFYYAELTYSDELSWDLDNDGCFGERSDDEVDVHAEICIGRIPFSDESLVQKICDNMVYFERNNDPSYKKNMLLLGAFFWNDTDTASCMDQISLHPSVADWTVTTMYEKNLQYHSSYECDLSLSNANVFKTLAEQRFSMLNWAGHGTPGSVHTLGLNRSSFLCIDDLNLLDYLSPSVVFANACGNGDVDYPNLAQSMMKQGVVGFIGPTKTSFAAHHWQHPADGSAQSLNYFFTTSFCSGNFTLGEAHEQALRQMSTNDLWFDEWYETCIWSSLFGNPSMSMNAVGPFPDLKIESITGGKGITVTCANRGEEVARNITCFFKIDHGQFLLNRNSVQQISFLHENQTVTVHLPVFGLGLGVVSHYPEITIRIYEASIGSVEKTVKTKIIGPFVFIETII